MNDNDCGICLDNCDTKLTCGHYFHKECVLRWMSVDNRSNDKKFKCNLCFKLYSYDDTINLDIFDDAMEHSIKVDNVEFIDNFYSKNIKSKKLVDYYICKIYEFDSINIFNYLIKNKIDCLIYNSESILYSAHFKEELYFYKGIHKNTNFDNKILKRIFDFNNYNLFFKFVEKCMHNNSFDLLRYVCDNKTNCSKKCKHLSKNDHMQEYFSKNKCTCNDDILQYLYKNIYNLRNNSNDIISFVIYLNYADLYNHIYKKKCHSECVKQYKIIIQRNIITFLDNLNSKDLPIYIDCLLKSCYKNIAMTKPK
jgi:hypothetical protein